MNNQQIKSDEEIRKTLHGSTSEKVQHKFCYKKFSSRGFENRFLRFLIQQWCSLARCTSLHKNSYLNFRSVTQIGCLPRSGRFLLLETSLDGWSRLQIGEREAKCYQSRFSVNLFYGDLIRKDRGLFYRVGLQNKWILNTCTGKDFD